MYVNEYWGGKREGAGRPKGNKTKPVRLTEKEQELIQAIRDKNCLNSVSTWVNVHARSYPDD